jgi:hypothetical protein
LGLDSPVEFYTCTPWRVPIRIREGVYKSRNPASLARVWMRPSVRASRSDPDVNSFTNASSQRFIAYGQFKSFVVDFVHYILGFNGPSCVRELFALLNSAGLSLLVHPNSANAERLVTAGTGHDSFARYRDCSTGTVKIKFALDSDFRFHFFLQPALPDVSPLCLFKPMVASPSEKYRPHPF